MSQSRSERLMANVGEDVDVVAIINGGEPFLDSAFWYFGNLRTGVFEGSKIFISRDGAVDIVVNVLEEQAARTGDANVHVYKNADEYRSIIKEILANCKRVGINSETALYQSVRNLKKIKKRLKFIDVSEAIGKTVAIKEPDEIRSIESACRISSIVANELPDMISEGVTEKEVAADMDIRMRKLGGTGNAFETIAAFGANAADCHHKPNDYRLRRGDTALFDFGSKYDMYCSDLTRTIFLGEPDERLKRAYEVVLKAQEAGISMIRDGVSAGDVDMAARKIIDDSEFKGRFIHSFGHGIGMDVHQNIHVAPRSEQILRAGNVISAEPGIYIPGLGGIRIEDTVLVTEDGCRRLTDYDRSYTVV